MHDLIAAPFQDHHLILRPGSQRAVKIGAARYADLEHAVATGRHLPGWLADVALRAWGVDTADRTADTAVLIRARGPFEFSRATWEINLGCDFDCEHCYLGQKRFDSLSWDGKDHLLHVMRDAGVIWLQITGGEPLIDPAFPAAYRLAHELGMQVELLSNGSQLSKPRILDLLTTYPPTKMSLSVYGATAETYDAVTRRRGAFQRFAKGLQAAVEAGVNIDLSLIITNRSAHEADAMQAWADRLGLPRRQYATISPTIHGGAEPLPSQSPEYLTHRKPFTGCPAGRTFFHVDPHGRASICKVGREPSIDIPTEGLTGLARLGSIADSLMLRTGGCSGCKLSGTCRVCRPMAKLLQTAKAPPHTYCQNA
ncbi:radical SAM protein [Streptomyces sp. NPDC045470]|uniref:radical SAM protein n=1 Tax=Streptomyces sp. NPDC045470 TaxID=3155469 RepID=UPI0033F8F661